MATFLIFIVVLGVMVFVHELGHFLVARRNGILVEEFAFGFRPRLWSKKIGETTYAINLIPLGGYVKMLGESDGQTGVRSFRSQSGWVRFKVLVAGAVMNLVLGWVILTALFAVGFNPFFSISKSDRFISERPHVQINQVLPNTPAAKAGLKPGDIVTAINGEPVFNDTDFVQLVNAKRGEEVTLLITRGDQKKEIGALARKTPPKNQGAIGVAISQSGKVRSTWYKAPLASIYETGNLISQSVIAFGGLIKDLIVHQEVSPNVTGIVGVGVLTGAAWRLGFSYLVQLVAVISIGLGVINLMPIPPLDGGHIAVLAIEKLTRRKLSERTQSAIATAGLAFILLIFVAVTFKDFIRFDVWGRIF